MRFVLASASPARLSVLRSAGIEPLVQVSGIDEDAVAAALPEPSPEELVTALARAKAEAVVADIAATEPDAVIVGCDSMLLMAHGEIVGKPGTREAAAKRWAQNAGSTGELLTGHAVVRLRNGEISACAQRHLGTTVRFGEPTEAELDAYLATGEPLHVAGGFTLEGFGGWFIEGVDGDPSSVLGISLPLTRKLLAEVGVSVVTLWRRPTAE
ncbi:Maf family protein [Saccharopolyspora phatthalungensis]|uniref:Nucleoside triphosphate pyrophosphatase n=1 Tax=Saccharopolyspora phatthalungensis TaxID=664693 RepID=A0A840Q928_9PSEU|nr:nucleoside triphosphate pyrophosphatase [Saccharopolyspora phatthalungensis]MBB5155109.1 septum formation protein [Saccharopolyspora phatthalungensis]